MNGFNIRQCAVCGSICQRIKTTNTTILVDNEPVLIYKTKPGKDVGYTLDGRRIEGTLTEPADRIKGFGYYEVHRIHLCGRKLDQVSTGGGR
jgi:hypothetical protein